MKTIFFTLGILLLSNFIFAQANLAVDGKTITKNLQITTGATNGYILRSDASGNATWVNPLGLPLTDSDWTIGTGKIFNLVMVKK